MQTIEHKLSRIPAVVKALGADATRHLIHATGGSPRRARRAFKAGVQDQLIATYNAALHDGLAHIQAVAKCGSVWADLFPSGQAVSEPGDEPEDEGDAEPGDGDPDEHGEEDDGAAVEALAALAKAAARPGKKARAADLKALLPSDADAATA